MIMTTGSPYDDIRNLLAALPTGNGKDFTPPSGAAAGFGGAGNLPQISSWLTEWSGKGARIEKPMIAVFAGAHGILRHGVAEANDADVQGLIDAISAGTAPIAKICGGANIGLKVLDLAVDLPTGDITQADALDERDCAATMAFGMEAVAGGHDLLCLSAAGAGGNTVAVAVLATLFGDTAQDWAEVEPSAGQHLRLRRIGVLETALARHGSSVGDGLSVIGELGGREIAAMAGAIIAARMERIPVLIDGLPALAAAAALYKADAAAIAHCRLAARPLTPTVTEAARALGLDWIAEGGSGGAPGLDGALAVGVVRAAAWAAT
jgi:nicotinate-nucleotide--dimethylbenzimidazole phosphoribosyltransferase